MNTISIPNNQPAFGMKQSLKSAEIIQRRAKNTYQHFSPYLFEQRLNDESSKNLRIILKKIKNSLMEFRDNIYKSQNPQKLLIEDLKNGQKLANGGEEVELAAIIGKMNGQKNIYTGRIDGLDHAVTFITNKIVKNGQKQTLANKDAIIIDPQLGITDYAGNYFMKLKDKMGNSYRHGVKNDAGVTVMPTFDKKLNKAQMADLKSNYPELLIADYKTVKV